MLPKPVVLVSALVSLGTFSVEADMGGTAPTESLCLPCALLGCVRGLGGNLGLGLGGVGLGLRCLLLTVRPLRKDPRGEGSNLCVSGGGGRMLNLLGFFLSPVLAVAAVESVGSVSLDRARWNLAISLWEITFRSGCSAEMVPGAMLANEGAISESLDRGLSGVVAHTNIVPSAATVTSFMAARSSGAACDFSSAMSVTPSVWPQSLASNVPSSEYMRTDLSLPATPATMGDPAVEGR